jgi:hypothetical protein
LACSGSVGIFKQQAKKLLCQQMEVRFKRRGPILRSTPASILAAILLVAQCLAVAHYHSQQSTLRYASAGASLDNGLCSLCLFHQYSPTVAAAAPFPFSLTVIGLLDLYAAQTWPLYTFNSYLSGRSPPALA